MKNLNNVSVDKTHTHVQCDLQCHHSNETCSDNAGKPSLVLNQGIPQKVEAKPSKKSSMLKKLLNVIIMVFLVTVSSSFIEPHLLSVSGDIAIFTQLQGLLPYLLKVGLNTFYSWLLPFKSNLLKQWVFKGRQTKVESPPVEATPSESSAVDTDETKKGM